MLKCIEYHRLYCYRVEFTPDTRVDVTGSEVVRLIKDRLDLWDSWLPRLWAGAASATGDEHMVLYLHLQSPSPLQEQEHIIIRIWTEVQLYNTLSTYTMIPNGAFSSHLETTKNKIVFKDWTNLNKLFLLYSIRLILCLTLCHLDLGPTNQQGTWIYQKGSNLQSTSQARHVGK